MEETCRLTTYLEWHNKLMTYEFESFEEKNIPPLATMKKLTPVPYARD